MQYGEAGARGYLYTVDTIPGYAGQMPSLGGNRVLCFENRSGTYDFQTDCFLRYGSEFTEGVSDPALLETIPGDVWFQFWVYLQNYGTQAGYTPRGKLIYPSRVGPTVPLSDPNGAAWLCDVRNASTAPVAHAENNALHQLFLESRSEYGTPDTQWNWLGTTSRDPDIFEQTVDRPIAQNTWTLVRLHYDCDQLGTGRYEAWLRDMGAPAFTKVADWLHGATVGDGAVTINPRQNYAGGFGHAFVSFLTTYGSLAGSPNNVDAWMYFSDFTIAASEAALPVYSGY